MLAVPQPWPEREVIIHLFTSEMEKLEKCHLRKEQRMELIGL